MGMVSQDDSDEDNDDNECLRVTTTSSLPGHTEVVDAIAMYRLSFATSLSRLGGRISELSNPCQQG